MQNTPPAKGNLTSENASFACKYKQQAIEFGWFPNPVFIAEDILEFRLCHASLIPTSWSYQSTIVIGVVQDLTVLLMENRLMTTAITSGRVFCAGLLLAIAAFTATAQEFRGSLAGKITDPNGAVVPGSKVEIKNTETGIVASAVTGEDGAYSFPLVQPGNTSSP